MEIEQKEGKFIELLHSYFQIEGEEQILIQDKVLTENGLGDRTFWKTTCPLLQKSGILKSFDDPDAPLSKFAKYYSSKHRGPQDLINDSRAGYAIASDIMLLQNGSIFDDVHEKAARMVEERRKLIRENFEHEFIVDAQKLLGSDTEFPTETIIHVDSKKGIYIDNKRKYPISGKRLKCVQKLLENVSLTAEDLEEFWSTSSQITNEINEINALVRKKLGIEHDLITHSKSARDYSLNREELSIEAS